MEAEILKHFIGMNVEVLVGGVWIEGHLRPIVKGVVTLLPIGEAASFYGPAALKQDTIQAIRQVRKTGPIEVPVEEVKPPNQVRSSLDEVTATQRFARKKQ
jgi:hypothetical protein